MKRNSVEFAALAANHAAMTVLNRFVREGFTLEQDVREAIRERVFELVLTKELEKIK